MLVLREDAQNAVREDSDKFEKIESKLIDQRRWVTVYEGVFKYLPTGKFYTVCWEEPSTEIQDSQPFEYEKEVEFTEVHQVEEVVKIWKKVA